MMFAYGFEMKRKDKRFLLKYKDKIILQNKFSLPT